MSNKEEDMQVPDVDQIYDLLRKSILNHDSKDISELESQLILFSKMFIKAEESGEFPEDLYDSELELSEILNDSNFRSDEIGENACKNPYILDLVYNYLAIFNENIEVVLATNPFISENLFRKLADSEYEWEEDGTRQTLARNSSNEAVLEMLGSLEDWNVQYAVARNPNTPSKVLERLVESTGQCNFQIEEIIFGEISTYKGFVRHAVITNKNCPRSALEKVISGGTTSLGEEVDKEMSNIASKKL